MFSNTEGEHNAALGHKALYSNTVGYQNTACGEQSLLSNTTGYFNTALGFLAGANLTTGSANIDIGNGGVAGESNTIRIGNNLIQTATYVAGIAGQTVGAGGSTCYVDNDGKLGVFLSAQRFKTDITDMGDASEALLALRPVTFHYKPELDKTGIPQFGLVAEEVAEVNADLVTHDAKGELSSVRYEAVNAMLLNEFLKEYRKGEEQDRKILKQEAAIAKQQNQIDALKQELKEQKALIEKVNARIERAEGASQLIVDKL